MRFPTTAQSSTLPLLMLLQQNAAAAALSISSPNPLPSLATETQTPDQNLLTYLFATHDTTLKFSSAALCTSFLSRNKTALLLPNARIPLSPAGFIDCFLEPQASQEQGKDYQKQQLVFTGIPAGWQFSITEITVAGWLDLERGSFVEWVSLSLIYNPVATTEKIGGGGGGGGGKEGDTSSSSMGHIMHNSEEEEEVERVEKGWKWKWKWKWEIRKTRRRASLSSLLEESQTCGGLMVDQATALTPYGRFGTGYQGGFNLSMPVKPQSNPKAGVCGSSSTQDDKGRRDRLAVSPCSTGTEMEIALGAELWFALSNEQIEFDDSIVHRGRLGAEDGEPGKPGKLPGEGDGHEKTLRIGMMGEWKKC